MPSIQRIVTTALSTTNPNVFNGTEYERVPGTLRHQITLILAQIDEVANDVQATFTIGGRVVMPESGLSVDAAAPVEDRHTLVRNAIGNPGEIILLRLVNTDAAAAVVCGVRMHLQPIAV